MNWILLALMTASFYALYNVFIKIASGHIHGVAGAVILQIVAALLGGIWLLVLWWRGTPLEVSPIGVKWAMIAGVFVGLAEITSFFVFSKGVPASTGIAIIIGGSVAIGGVIAVIAIIVAGICFGFLPHNFHPARIFMGDAGALLLGLLMAAATIAVGGNTDQPFSGQTFFFFAPLFLPLVILGVPILDTIWALLRRAKGRSGLTIADKGHLHHRLMRLGHGQRRAVLILWTWTALLSAFVLDLKILAWTTPAVLALSLLVALARGARSPALFPVKAFAVAFTDVFRGIPTILVITLIGFGVPGAIAAPSVT